MRIGLTKKLFFLTVTLCTLVLSALFLFQTFFFQHLYLDRKSAAIFEDVRSLQSVIENAEDNPSKFQALQSFYRDHQTFVAIIDEDGNLKSPLNIEFEAIVDIHETSRLVKELKPFLSPIDDRYVQFQIPLAFLLGSNPGTLLDLNNRLLRGEQLQFLLWGRTGVQGILPSSLAIFGSGTETATIVAEPIHLKNSDLHRLFSKEEFIPDNFQMKGNFYVHGTITSDTIPTHSLTWLIDNHLLLDQLRKIQTKLIEGLHIPLEGMYLNETINTVHYRIFLTAIDEGGESGFIIAMSSMQPVGDALAMIQDYYLYVAFFVLLLVLAMSSYYSRFLVKPLLEINRATQEIVNLNFNTTIKISSTDEIGVLGKNINILSNQLNRHITHLQKEIEKERALEETRKEFISNISHELKTPLSVIKSSTEILQEGFLEEEEKVYFFNAINEEIEHMDLLIVDMLELAKLTSGTFKMAQEVFELSGLVRGILEKQKVAATKKNLKVFSRLPFSKVFGNPRYIGQVVTNFITNAIFYTPEGENIIILLDIKDKYVRFSVENKGIHIPLEQLDKIWDRFYRVDKARIRSEGGTGLGLAISQSILELHHARYGALNTQDGVLFYFFLQSPG